MSPPVGFHYYDGCFSFRAKSGTLDIINCLVTTVSNHIANLRYEFLARCSTECSALFKFFQIFKFCEFNCWNECNHPSKTNKHIAAINKSLSLVFRDEPDHEDPAKLPTSLLALVEWLVYVQVNAIKQLSFCKYCIFLHS